MPTKLSKPVSRETKQRPSWLGGVTATKPYNSNNAWGFGGMFGTETLFSSGWRERKGKACFRHLPPEPLVYWLSPEGKRFDSLPASLC